LSATELDWRLSAMRNHAADGKPEPS
jgi:hypothetical protein